MQRSCKCSTELMHFVAQSHKYFGFLPLSSFMSMLQLASSKLTHPTPRHLMHLQLCHKLLHLVIKDLSIFKDIRPIRPVYFVPIWTFIMWMQLCLCAATCQLQQSTTISLNSTQTQSSLCSLFVSPSRSLSATAIRTLKRPRQIPLTISTEIKARRAAN